MNKMTSTYISYRYRNISLLLKRLVFNSATVLFGAFLVFAAHASSVEKAQKIADMMVTNAQYAAIMAARKDQIAEQTKAALEPHFDFSTISDKDFDTFMDLFAKETANGMVAGLRVAFRDKFAAEMTEKDLDLMLECFGGGVCKPDAYSPNGLKALLGLQKFGKREGARIGALVGISVNDKMLEIVEANEGKLFENPQSVAKFLRLQISRR